MYESHPKSFISNSGFVGIICFGSFDRACVGFEEIGFDLESSEVADFEELQKLPGSISRNRQSTDETTTTTTTINDERVRFETRVERRGIFVERVEFWENIGVGRNQPLGVGKFMTYCNVEGF